MIKGKVRIHRHLRISLPEAGYGPIMRADLETAMLICCAVILLLATFHVIHL